MRLVAILGAAVAVALALPVPGRLGPRTLGRGMRRRPGLGLVALGAATVAAMSASVHGLHLALGLVVIGVLVAAAVLVRQARRTRRAHWRRARVVEVCEALVGELRAGQPLVASLERCGDLWADIEPVVAASRLGADVPSALRRQAQRLGAEGLAEVAAAWQVSQASGAGLATALSQVARTARERQATWHLVRGELASAQATARLVAGLPVAVLSMSAGIGGDPWHFLFETPAGIGCLALGAGLTFAGLFWIDQIAAAVLREG